jgi:hypothetical protein
MLLAAISARRAVSSITVIGLTGVLATSGWAIAAGYASALFVAIAVVGLCALALTQRGAFIGLLLVAAMNGLPFIDTSQIVTNKLTVADLTIVALFITAVLWLLLDNGTYRPSSIGRAISRAAVPLLLWWLFTLARSVISQHVPALHAAAFGRDFLFFALLLLVLPRVRLGSQDIGTLLGVLAAAVCLFAVGQIATATGFGQPAGVFHFGYTGEQSGLTRVYANMTDLVTAGLATAIAASLLARQRMVRAVARPVVLLLTVSVVVQLTRARWLGLVIGLLLVSLWLIIYSEASLSALLRRRLAIVAGVFGIGGVVVLLVVPGTLTGGTFAQRVFSIISDLESGGGTVAVREAATRTATGYLGGQWPLGLGLVPPASHYFEGLPEGSIRDTDLGVLGAITTMGVIGAMLIYAPVVLMLVHCLRRSARQTKYYWLRYGGAVWIAATLASSATLVTLSSTSGLVLTAVFLTVLAHPSVSGALAPMAAVSPHGSSPLAAPGHRVPYRAPAAPTAARH